MSQRSLRPSRVLAVAASLVLASPAFADDLVITQWGVAMSGADYAVALDQGHFKAAGADVTGVIAAQGGGTSVRAALASAGGYGMVSLAAAVSAIRAGEDLKIVHSAVSSAADSVWVTMPNSDVKTLKDAKGKSLAITNPKGWSEMFAVLALAHEGLPPDSVTIKALGSISGGLTGLEKGAVAVALAVEPGWSAKKSQYRMVFDGRNLPPVTQAVGIATGQLMREQPQKLRAIIEGRRQAIRAIYKDPKAAAASISKYYTSIPTAVVMDVTASMAAARYWDEGAFNKEALDRMIEGLRAIGAFKGDKVDWDALTDSSFLPKDLGGK